MAQRSRNERWFKARKILSCRLPWPQNDADREGCCGGIVPDADGMESHMSCYCG